jgi:hypothetical protein
MVDNIKLGQIFLGTLQFSPRQYHSTIAPHSSIPLSLTVGYHVLASDRDFMVHLIYRVRIKSFPDYKHLLQETYVEYKHIFLPLLNLVSKILCHVFIVTFGFWMKHFQTGGLGEMVRHPGHHGRRISPP